MASHLRRLKNRFVWGFRRNVLRHDFNTRIHQAAMDGKVEKVMNIVASGDGCVNDRDKKKRTPLHYACAYGRTEVVAYLVKKKCNLELLDDDYNTALIKASEHQHEECVNILLNNGANPNVQDYLGYSPLHNAVFSNDPKMVEMLLAHNAYMEFQNKDGHTPLLLALKHNKQEIAALLIQRQANIHAVDKEGRTALILAAKYEANGIVQLLLQKGIDVFAEDHFGNNALMCAIKSGFNVKTILEHTRSIPLTVKTSNPVDKKSSQCDPVRSSKKPAPVEVKRFEAKIAPYLGNNQEI